jgi:RNA 3'-terminal phosphate cyclase (ATP)
MNRETRIPANRLVRIDGAQGEGGGQILRTALALAALRGTPVAVHSIRAGRRKPGLQAQHLSAVTALQDICRASVEGAHIGSTEVTFAPEPIRAGDYRCAVGTAGSIALVIQAILCPLALADGPSRVTVHGGTHVPWSPPIQYLTAVLLPVLEMAGVEARVRLVRWGFYPRGEGEVILEVKGGAQLRPIALVRTATAPRIRGLSVVSRLRRGIADRQRERVLARLEAQGLSADVEVAEVEAADAGSFLFLGVDGGTVPAGFSALGERGKPAERVADEAVDDLLAYLQSEAACDPHLADQVSVPMAAAPGTSRLTTARLSRHLLSALAVSQQLLGCSYQLSGPEGTSGSVTVEGVGLRGSSTEHRAQGTEHRAQRTEQSTQGTGPDHAVRHASGAVRERSEDGAQGTGHREARGESREPCAADVVVTPDPQSPPVVRKARASDVPAMQALVAQFAARGELLPRTLNEFYQQLRDFFVAEVAGEVVGICALSLYWEDLAEVRSLAVQEAHGGRGLGASLVRACVAEASALGIRRVFALTYRPGFFARLGFREIDKRELPQKIWKDCFKCAKFANCDETAVIRGAASHEP